MRDPTRPLLAHSRQAQAPPDGSCYAHCATALGEWAVAQQQRVQRRLAAILAADVAGYSRLTGADEEGTLERLRALRREVIDRSIAEYLGRIVKTTGDGLLVEFASVVDAVRCAIAIQRAMAQRNTEVSPDRRIVFRIGINLGDVVAEGDDLLGDGVNVAARLEGIAEPGGIYLSRAAYDQARGKIDLAVRDLGERRLKNIAEPIQVYSVTVDGSVRLGDGAHGKRPAVLNRRVSSTYRTGAGIAGAVGILLAVVAGVAWLATKSEPSSPMQQAQRFSIVVLPFANLGGDPVQDYLADVITDEVTNGLSRIKGSFVIARTTAFTYRGKAIDVKQVGKDLSVRYVLEGAAQPNGRSVRVTAQLIDAETGANLWTDQFDADRSNLLQMQDEITARLARTLEFRLWDIDVARVLRTSPKNADAEDLAVKCFADAYFPNRQWWVLCEQALQIDSNNVRALVGMAWKSIEPFAFGRQSSDPQGDVRRADEMIERALDIDPNYYAAHHVRGWILLAQKRTEEATLEFDRVLALNPASVDAYHSLAVANNVLGRPNKAVEYDDSAIRLSPRDPGLFAFYGVRGIAYFQLRHDDQAIASLRRSVGLVAVPSFQAFLVAALALNEQPAEARDILARYLSAVDNRPRTIAQWREQVQAYSDNPTWLASGERFYAGLRNAGMPEE